MLINEAKHRNVILGNHLLYRSFFIKSEYKKNSRIIISLSVPSIFDNLSSIYFKIDFSRQIIVFAQHFQNVCVEKVYVLVYINYSK